MSNPSLEAQVEPHVISGFVAEIGGDTSATVPLLQAVQGLYGYLPRLALDMIIEQTQISGRQLYGVATFYAQFRMTPVGRHLIKVCHGTACHVTGADRLNTSLRYSLGMTDEEADTSSNGGYTIVDVACIGCCSQAPLIVIGDEVTGNINGAGSQKALRKHARKSGEELAKPVKTVKEA